MTFRESESEAWRERGWGWGVDHASLLTCLIPRTSIVCLCQGYPLLVISFSFLIKLVSYSYSSHSNGPNLTMNLKYFITELLIALEIWNNVCMFFSFLYLVEIWFAWESGCFYICILWRFNMDNMSIIISIKILTMQSHEAYTSPFILCYDIHHCQLHNLIRVT